LKASERKKVADVVQKMVDEHQVIDSVKEVLKMLKEKHDLQLKAPELRQIMREDLGLRWRKIKEVSLHENSVRNLVLRQRFAMALLEAAMTKTRIINIDESWLGMEDFRRMKWQPPLNSNFVGKKLWQPRISLLLALDNYGESYVAVSQSNTNSNTILLFIRGLVKQLNESSRHWRRNTFIYWDGAGYHQSATTLKLLRDLQVPIMVSGPHSYEAAPCELWFSLFKRVNINPRKLKTGKR
jgi:hypothetical protein